MRGAGLVNGGVIWEAVNQIQAMVAEQAYEPDGV
jgi:hypothetical protein